ncbi:Transcriptional regulator, AcrR family [hydrothermal vent metagenome]|uniref:Transcriptional regulator, AcrR family n=1 Tax=hydrothermal vent metagenome TaxID=652676 RepID=A0A3B0XDG0_9ZZZZ
MSAPHLTSLDDQSTIFYMKPTKEIIIQSGIEILLEKGYNGSGLKEILDAAGVPKGSFYHFFKNKEDFAKEALSYYSNAFIPLLQQYLVDSPHPPVNRMTLFFKAMTDIFESQKSCKGGCLVGNMAQELADVNTPLRTHILQIMEIWNSYFTLCINEAKKKGELSQSTDSHELAEFILNSWEGALLKMKIVNSAAPLRNFNRQITRILECYP